MTPKTGRLTLAALLFLPLGWDAHHLATNFSPAGQKMPPPECMDPSFRFRPPFLHN